LGELPEQEAAYELALERRPELLALSHRADSARYAVERAKAEADPQLGLLGQYTVQTPTDTLPSHHELVGLEFSWPFSNPTQSGQVESAEAGTREVAALREQLQQAIRLQVAEASFKVAEGKVRYGTAEQSLEAAWLAADKAEAAYQAGALLKRHLIEATTARSQAEAGLARAGFALDAASLNYARALGLLRELLDTRPPEVEIQ
jgi:outer membrane protein TolC